MIIDKNSVRDIIAGLADSTNVDDYETDDYGQVIILTGFYRYKNGTYHDQPEKVVGPDCSCDSRRTDAGGTFKTCPKHDEPRPPCQIFVSSHLCPGCRE